MRRRRCHRPAKRLCGDMPEARSSRRSEHPALGETVASERSSSERREDVVRLAPETLRLLIPQLDDKRLVDAIEERHLAHRCPRLRPHSPWLFPASKGGQLTIHPDDSIDKVDVRPGQPSKLRDPQARVGHDDYGVAVRRCRSTDQPLDLGWPQNPSVEGLSHSLLREVVGRQRREGIVRRVAGVPREPKDHAETGDDSRHRPLSQSFLASLAPKAAQLGDQQRARPSTRSWRSSCVRGTARCSATSRLGSRRASVASAYRQTTRASKSANASAATAASVTFSESGLPPSSVSALAFFQVVRA